MKAMRDVWGDTLVELGNTNPNVLVLYADLANSTKADKFAKACPGRFLQMGIAEQNFIGAAVGLASVGYIPWLSTFTVFFTHRALDPIRMLVAQTHANVKLGAAYAGVLTGLTGLGSADGLSKSYREPMSEPRINAVAGVDSWNETKTSGKPRGGLTLKRHYRPNENSRFLLNVTPETAEWKYISFTVRS